MSDYGLRISALQDRLRSQGATMAILAGTDQMRYLTGWKEGGHERFVGLFVPSQGDLTLVVPAMNAPQARCTPAGIKNVIGWSDETGWRTEANEALGECLSGDDKIVLVDDELLSVHLLSLQDLYANARFVPAGYSMSKLREIKTDGELASMQRAADLIDSIIEESYTVLREGMTELDLQGWFLDAFRRYQTQPSFTPTCCFGVNGALPHHHTGSSRLQVGDVMVIDVGCLSDHYASDITRTVAFRSVGDADAAKIYDLVLKSHTAARASAMPGVSGEAVDSAARKVITDAGCGEQFMHRTGHGIGLSTHEPPYLVKGNAEPLEPGMCFSVEPGVYLPGRFGVRIENIVTMTANGVKSLNAEPADHLRVVG
jgi:Xaa-Pro aminopeptidase